MARGGNIDDVPNQPKHKGTLIRMPAELKTALQQKAASEGSDMTKVIVQLVEGYLHEDSRDAGDHMGEA